jgi:hypothetical protein
MKKLVDLRFYETYHYANILSNVISDPFSYLHGIHSWYEDNEEATFLPAFPKISRLHGFAAHIISSLIDEQISNPEINQVSRTGINDVWIDRALRYHNLPCEGFQEFCKYPSISSNTLVEDDLFDYHQELRLSGEIEKLVEHLAKEVFYVLFGNRAFLAQFNYFMAGALQLFFSEVPDSVLGRQISKPGVLKRATLPMWVKRAVFYRDRGMCTFCQKDLSGTVSSQPDSQFDHIIALASGGMNDVTNIQLLCQPCNGSKSSSCVPVSSKYEAWY